MINPSPQLMMCLLVLAPSTSLIMGVTGQTLAQDCAVANTVWKGFGKPAFSAALLSNCCGYQGIICKNSRVSQLQWKLKNLAGSISPEIGKLTALVNIYLGDNQITGSIPPEIGNLPNLQQLLIGWNKLTGTIPVSIGNLNNLNWLTLARNQLSGAIPTEIGGLTKLTNLWLHNNQFSSVPSNLCTGLTLLQKGSLANNLFTSIPTQCKSSAITAFPNNQVTSVHYNLVKFATIGTISSTNGLWGAFMGTTAGLRKRQFVSVEGTVVSANDLYNMCPLNDVQNADVPAGCVAGIYHKFCTKPGDRTVLTNCQAAFNTVFAKSVFSTLGDVCPAWRKGPRSADCNAAVSTFSKIVYPNGESFRLTSEHARQLVDTIFASSTYAPCNKAFQTCASY